MPPFLVQICIAGTARDRSLNLPLLLISGHKDSVREDRATKYKSILKKNNILQSVIITVNKEGGEEEEE